MNDAHSLNLNWSPVRSLFIFFISSFLGSSLYGQLVNIETLRMETDSIQFALKSDFLFNYSNTDGTYIYQFDFNITSQYKTRDLNNTFFFNVNYGLIRSKGVDYQNSWFIHARYIRKLSRVLRLETFVQDQSNELLSINSRQLLGIGFRGKLIDNDLVRMYFGNSYMYEKEKSDVVNESFYNSRNSSYLSIAVNLNKSKLVLVNTFYFQPLYTDISNFRILEQFKAEMPLIGNFKVSGLFNYFYNNISPLGESEFSSVVSIGLTFEI